MELRLQKNSVRLTHLLKEMKSKLHLAVRLAYLGNLIGKIIKFA